MDFKTVGIVCEYNPFHYGHKYHIEKTRALTGCENIVCIMSGSMVQRGECAIFDKWQRAKSAIEGGADLVVELPAYYVLQSADIFAKGAIEILDGMKIVNALSFGCECGDIDTIKKLASVMTCSDGKYDEYIKEDIKKGTGYPKASQNALKKCVPDIDEDFLKPNNTLGIGYVKAINSLNSKIEPVCIKRDNDYHGSFSNDSYTSASEIRKMIMENKDYHLYSDDFSGFDIYNLKNAESYILGSLRMMTTDVLDNIKGAEPGLSNLIKNSALKACTLEDLFDMCVGKRYTMHRIKRYIMCALLNINYDEDAKYFRVLGIGKNGPELLKEIKEKSKLDIITKVANYKKQNLMFETDIKATDLASLCCDNVNLRYCSKDFTTSPYIKKASH